MSVHWFLLSYSLLSVMACSTRRAVTRA